MCVCVCECLYVCVYVSVYVCVCVCMSLWLCVWYECPSLSVYVSVSLSVCVRSRSKIVSMTCVYMCLCMFIHVFFPEGRRSRTNFDIEIWFLWPALNTNPTYLYTLKNAYNIPETEKQLENPKVMKLLLIITRLRGLIRVLALWGGPKSVLHVLVSLFLLDDVK